MYYTGPALIMSGKKLGVILRTLVHDTMRALHCAYDTASAQPIQPPSGCGTAATEHKQSDFDRGTEIFLPVHIRGDWRPQEEVKRRTKKRTKTI
jgi:hypothetical protein